MSTALRTAHSSYVDLDPSEYVYVGSYDFGDDTPGRFMGEPREYTMDDGEVVVANNWTHAEYCYFTRVLRRSKTSRWDATGQCDHCGARMRYTVIMRHTPSGDHIAIGETCHTERFSHDSKVAKDIDRLQKQAAAVRALAKVRKAVDAWMATDPRNTEAVEYAEAHREGNDFYDSLLDKLRQYGPWSDRQRDAVLKGKVRDAERAANPPEPEVIPVPEGRYEVVGTVVKTDWQDNDFGGRAVMTVKDDRGFFVWGTKPSAIYGAAKDDRVRFTATVERSERAENFGFYKRPAKAEVIEA